MRDLGMSGMNMADETLSYRFRGFEKHLCLCVKMVSNKLIPQALQIWTFAQHFIWWVLILSEATSSKYAVLWKWNRVKKVCYKTRILLPRWILPTCLITQLSWGTFAHLLWKFGDGIQHHAKLNVAYWWASYPNSICCATNCAARHKGFFVLKNSTSVGEGKKHHAYTNTWNTLMTHNKQCFWLCKLLHNEIY